MTSRFGICSLGLLAASLAGGCFISTGSPGDGPFGPVPGGEDGGIGPSDDGGPPPDDGGGADGSPWTPDDGGGPPPDDGGPPPDDGGPPPDDSGPPPDDGGPPPDDGGPPPDDGGPMPGDLVEFFTYAEQNGDTGSGWGAALTDVHRHLPSSYGTYYRDSDLITSAHETTHGINSHLRNYFNETGERANGFYVMEDRAIILVEPGIRKSDVGGFVPASLRGSRYDLYIAGMSSWDDTPLYVYDEWVAYTNGGAVGVDLVSSGLWHAGWRDGVAGNLEFTVYALALAMAVEELDPHYFAANVQFREFTAWHARRCMDVYREGAVMPDFAWDRMDSYHASLREAPDAADLRDFARRVYGDEWARDVLGLE